jgi:ATP-dependent DNA helicase RecQ
LAKFDPARAAFLQSLVQAAKRGRTWLTLDADDVGRKLNQPRERIVAALDYLDECGDLLVEATGVRQGYRRLQIPADRESFVNSLADRFLEHEAHDIARVRSVVALAEHQGCLTQSLLAYFGEERGDCGHCRHCEGFQSRPLASSNGKWSPQSAELAAIRNLQAERHEALRSPRQLARFLCGITSPATTRTKLRSRPEFGQCSQVPFADVLALAERK